MPVLIKRRPYSRHSLIWILFKYKIQYKVEKNEEKWYLRMKDRQFDVFFQSWGQLRITVFGFNAPKPADWILEFEKNGYSTNYLTL